MKTIGIRTEAYVVDPMYICRNYPIPDWDGKDMRQIIYDTFGAYSAMAYHGIARKFTRTSVKTTTAR